MDKRLRIAVADDEPLMRRYFQEVLPRLGHELVGVAENGVELVHLARHGNLDLVITDIRMPDMDGLEAALHLSHPNPLPVLFVTGCAEEVTHQPSGPWQTVMVLRKPIGRTELANAIQRLLLQHRVWETVRREATDPTQLAEDRARVEDAVAVLIAKQQWEETQAWQYLRQLAASTGQRLAELALQIVRRGHLPIYDAQCGMT